MADPLSGMGDGGSAMQDDAARDILNAIKANDPKSLSLALQRHYEACDEGGYDMDDDGKEMGPPSSGP